MRAPMRWNMRQPASERAEIMTIIAENLQAVHERIRQAAAAANHSPDSIRLLAVSKTFGAAVVASAWQAGQRAFGENFVQEALDKVAGLGHLDIEWHFIGPIQSNKTRPIAEHFAWVHSLEREKIARRLNVSALEVERVIDVGVAVTVVLGPLHARGHGHQVPHRHALVVENRAGIVRMDAVEAPSPDDTAAEPFDRREYAALTAPSASSVTEAAAPTTAISIERRYSSRR